MVDRLRAAGCVFAEEEAEILAASAGSVDELDALVTRRAAGEPLEQVVGWASFCGLRIDVDPGVFVPRRRSEFLVSVAAGAAPAAPVIADLCCGTGALGVAVAVAVADGTGDLNTGDFNTGDLNTGDLNTGELHAADLDPAAVACARRNVARVGGRAYLGDLFRALPASVRGRVDVLICNAPYVPTTEIAFMPAEARDHEALLALDGGTDGLAILRRVADAAAGWLAPGGVLLVETSERQAPAMAAALDAGGLAARTWSDDESGATVITGTPCQATFQNK